MVYKEIMKNTYKFLALLLTTFSLASTANVTAPTVYFNGDILTMEGDTPKYVEALVVKDNKIAYTGDMREALTQAGSNAALQDLKGTPYCLALLILGATLH